MPLIDMSENRRKLIEHAVDQIIRLATALADRGLSDDVQCTALDVLQTALRTGRPSPISINHCTFYGDGADIRSDDARADLGGKSGFAVSVGPNPTGENAPPSPTSPFAGNSFSPRRVVDDRDAPGNNLTAEDADEDDTDHKE